MVPAGMTDPFEKLFWEILRDGLANGEAMAVRGLGKFSITHSAGQIEGTGPQSRANDPNNSEAHDGIIHVSPPSDSIVFEGEISSTN